MSEPTMLEEMKQMVKIPGKNYSIGKYPVTQSLWESVMGKRSSRFEGHRQPVVRVTWFDCIAFCNKLSEKEGLEKAYTTNGEEVQCNFDADGYRLPTEWEWYFAARANENFEYAGSDSAGEVAWYRRNSNYETHPVGQKKGNGFGVFDMTGNVWEWCWDWFEGEFQDIPTENSTGPSDGLFRVIRGGCCNSDQSSSRVSFRLWNNQFYYNDHQGFRLCRTIR